MTAKSQQFINELVQFYRNKGQYNLTSDNLIVRLNGKPVNLCELYTSVIEMGGSFKVNQYNRWDEIYLKLFKLQPLGANVSVAVRQIYQKYLLAYERANFSNFMSDTMDNDDDDCTNKEISSNFSFLSNHNHQLSAFNQSSSQNSSHHRLSNNSTLSKLFCSLQSDLPNEMDFGLRVATILTNSETTDHLADFKFIDVIMECCVLYICSCESTAYSKCADYPLEEDVSDDLTSNKDHQINGESDREKIDQILSDQHKENVCNRTTNSRSVSTKFNDNNVRKFVPFKDCDCFVKFWCETISDIEILKFIFDLHDEQINELYESTYSQQEHQKNYFKIKRIVCLLKNLSYTIEKLRQDQQIYESDDCEKSLPLRDNASINLLRFFILLLNSDDQFFINIALEIMSNISPFINSNISSSLPSDQNTYARLLTTIYEWCVSKVISSPDVVCLNRCLEILAKLINANHLSINRLVISEILNQKSFIRRLSELLMCQHDIGVVISSLECCLTLSENYPKHLLNDNKHLIKILINLVNCEEEQYFSMATIRKVKIIDERTNAELSQQPMQILHRPQQQTIIIQQQPMNQAVAQQSSQKQINQQDLNHASILADNEQHVRNWYFANFESRPTNASGKSVTLKINEMYGDYVKHSCVTGRRNVVTTPTFSNLLKKYFPGILINQNDVTGLVKVPANRVNNKINIIQQPTVNSNQVLQISTNQTGTVITAGGTLTSPILKAHLSTPPKANATQTTSTVSSSCQTSQHQQQQAQFQNGSISAITPVGSTASPLIKNLLANKLRNNQTNSNSNSDLDSKSTIATNIVQQHQPNVSAGNFIFATNSSPTITSTAATLPNGACGPNLITVPLQQHIVPVSSSSSSVSNSNMIINANQLGSTGTMVMQPTQSPGGQQQFLLVRTIMPHQQNNANIVGSTTSNTGQQPMRIILPASVLGSQSQQTITINGAPGVGAPTLIAQQQQSHPQSIGMIGNADANQMVQPILLAPPQQHLNETNNSSMKPNEKDKLLKACLGSGTSTATPSTLANNIVTSTVVGESVNKSMSSSVNSSPLLNVLLDKGKLPEFSTVSNDQHLPSITSSTTTNQMTNHIIANSVSSLSSVSLAMTHTNTTSTLAANSSAQIITSTVNMNQPKMFILTTTSKSPLTLKNGNNMPITSASTAPIQSFIIQQPQNTGATVVSSEGKPQYILQQNPPTLVSQSLIVQPQTTNIISTTVQNPSTTTMISNSNSANSNSKPLDAQPTDAIATGSSSIEIVTTDNQQSNKPLANCVENQVNGDAFEESSEKHIEKSIETTSPILTNGFLEKDREAIENHDIKMQTDSDEIASKSPLLKRQLESDDSSSKKAKVESNSPSGPLTTIVNVKQEPVSNDTMIVTNTTNKNPPTPDEKLIPQNKIAIVSSNGILMPQPTISNTSIKQISNSSISTVKSNQAHSSTSGVVNQIKITKPPTMIIQSAPSKNSNAPSNPPQQISTTVSNSCHKIVATPVINIQSGVKANLSTVSKFEYVCEWNNCKKSFNKPQAVFLHVHNDHVLPLNDQSVKCSWGSPDGTGPGCKSLRPKYSLLTHLQDFHCGVNQLQAAAKRQQQLKTKGVTDMPPPIKPPAHPGYAKDAAFVAIRRHSNTNIVDHRPTSRLTAISKSVRLTAAMILRNLAQHSTSIKRSLKNYESYISELCIFDNREDSRTLAQCLATISQEQN